MSEHSNPAPLQIASTKALIKGTTVAVVVAAVLLLFVVLPAEYGVDPTGMGTRLGLTVMSETADEIGEPVEPAIDMQATLASVSVLDAVAKAQQPFRSDELSLTLQPNEGGEIKALMQGGERLMFTWTADGGAVNFDMHGEALNAPKDEFTSYWKGRNETSAHGAFQAPFAGTHGWYWRNRGATPVTIHVKTSGYYEKLFKP